jgi:Tol biopolymer transport system component
MNTRTSPSVLAALSLLCFAVACDRGSEIVEPEMLPLAAKTSGVAAHFSEWSMPVNLGATVNSPAVDNLPALSKDGLSFYFTSNRPGGSGALDLWVSRRAGIDEPWGSPVNLGPTVNSSDNDAAPNLSRDGHYLFITSNRPGGAGSNDIWVSWRADVHDDFAWEAPVNLGPPVNGPAFDAGAAIRRPEFYFTRGPAGNTLDIYVSSVSGESFGRPQLVAELSSAANDQRPTVRYDRREIFLSSNRPGGFGSDDIWGATRSSAAAAWTTPLNLGAVINTPFVESQPGLSEDGTLLFFSSDRPGGSGGLDIYVSTRRVNAQE